MSKSKLYNKIKQKYYKNKNKNKNKNKSNHSKNKKDNDKPQYSKNVTRKFKSLKCSPAVKNNLMVKGSCFTNDVLEQLKQTYNKHHVKDPILANDPTGIWNELRKKLKYCPKEDCWLSEITDETVKNKLSKLVFAPFQPDDWKGDPNPWLSNFDIFEVLKQYETPYPNFKIIGPTPIDFDTRPKDMGGQCVWEDLCTFTIEQFLSSKKTKLGVVFNLDEHDKKGSHWVSMFIDLEDQFIFYLDSGGDKIPPEIDKLVKRVMKQGLKMTPKMKIHFYENCPVEHQMGENECGMYALFFIITMLTNKTDDKEFTNYIDKIAFFKDKRIPDTYVKKFRNIYFNL